MRRLTNQFSLLDVTPLPLDRFSSSSSGFLIATDVAARGLDIPEQVVHYQVQEWEDSQGLSLFLVEPGKQTMLRKLCQTLAKDGDHTLPVFPVDQSRMGLV